MGGGHHSHDHRCYVLGGTDDYAPFIFRHESTERHRDNGDRCFSGVDNFGGWNQAKRHLPMDDNLSRSQEHKDAEVARGNFAFVDDCTAQLIGVFILEFGIIFHSIFIGLTLAVAGSEFTALYIVLTFHQTFEGLGLGSRLAMIPWPTSRRWTPYVLGTVYGLSTPIAIAVGLGMRNTHQPSGRTTLIVNGVFDAISAGILILHWPYGINCARVPVQLIYASSSSSHCLVGISSALPWCRTHGTARQMGLTVYILDYYGLSALALSQ